MKRCGCTSGDAAIQAQFETGRSREDKLSAVQYVRFALPPRRARAFLDPAVAARLAIDHPNYRHEVAAPGRGARLAVRGFRAVA